MALRVAVVGGGPAGASAAEGLAKAGIETYLFERKLDNAKPCGGAIPPRLVRDYYIPDELLCAHITSARMISPTDRAVDMPIENGYV
ncbi:MAG: FAD-dependent oxidoreductase, partial [Cyanobacteria bacterium J06639_1]